MSIATPNPDFSYRPDIDGLRAIAIILVVIFHAYPKFLQGGFIGVDIFFVISGYLITSIILKNQSQNNFSVLNFYSRRIKRIFPALIVILVFCLVAGWFSLLDNEYEQLGKHITAGSIYISNFVLQNESGYFDTNSELKPLLHLWSLAIEEQFYLIFPLLLIFSIRFHFNILWVILICLGFSFILNITQIAEDPTEVFFYPYTRAWELLLGSLVGYLTLHGILKKQVHSFANFLSWFGISLILVAWIFLDSSKIYFPSWWALMPTIGAACLIFSGEQAWFNRHILASKIAVFIGLISYPFYLWHWVLLSFLRITEVNKLSSLLRLSILLISLLLAWLTYYFVEKNLRFQKSNWVSLGLLVTLLFVGLVGYTIQKHGGYSERYFLNSNLTIGQKALKIEKSCADIYIKPHHHKLFKSEFCHVKQPNIPPTALLVGDSHSNHLYHGLMKRIDLTGENLLNLGLAGCLPFFDSFPDLEINCPWVMNEFLNMAINTPSIETVIMAGRAISEKYFIPKYIKRENFNSVEFKRTETENDPYIGFKNEMRNTLQRLSNAQKKIIFILDIPELEFNPNICIEHPWRLIKQLPTKKQCAIPRSQVDLHRQKYLEIVTGVLSEFPNVKVLDPIPILCDAIYCWAIKDHKMLYIDDHHLSIEGATYLAEHLPL